LEEVEMERFLITVIMIVIMTLTVSCATVPEVPDRGPCTDFIKAGTKGDCVGTPINKPI